MRAEGEEQKPGEVRNALPIRIKRKGETPQRTADSNLRVFLQGSHLSLYRQRIITSQTTEFFKTKGVFYL